MWTNHRPDRQMRSTNEEEEEDLDIASRVQSVDRQRSDKMLWYLDEIRRVVDSVCGAENADRKS